MRSQSLLMIGQQQNNPYPQPLITPSDESDDDLMPSIKIEPKLELSPPELVSTVATPQLSSSSQQSTIATSHHYFSLPSPAPTASLTSMGSTPSLLPPPPLAQTQLQPPPPPPSHAQTTNLPYGVQIKQETPTISDSVKQPIVNKKKNNTLVNNTPLQAGISTAPPTQSEQLQKLHKQNMLKQPHQGKSGPNLITIANYSGKVKPATLSDLEGFDMMHLPVDLDEAGNIDIIGDIDLDEDDDQMPELMQETHACFLSLIRDIFCSTPDHRATLENLQKKILQWMGNPITPLNDWYTLSENWLNLVPSAINFLSGEFNDQPEDFVPYIEYKINLAIYQWIGAGRDTDTHLIPLCQYWLTRKMEMVSKPTKNNNLGDKVMASNKGGGSHATGGGNSDLEDDGTPDRPPSPPPPRCITNWAVVKATPREVEEFRIQERERFEHPHMAFVYKMHGYESVVGPVKGIYTHQVPGVNKARGHTTLVADRPNFVTILTLVRDATARLPNGEGTRADICELLKSSQYINPDAADAILQTIVSGALDRMHTEHDPCVRYDPKRKIWIYLHRNRSKEEFERLHQQFQGLGKHKKATPRKMKPKKPIPNVTKAQSLLNVTSKVISPSVATTITSSAASAPIVVTSSLINPSSSSSSTSTSFISTSNIQLPPMQMPALSTISSSSSLNNPTPTSSHLINKIPMQKPIMSMKPELVPIKMPQSVDNKMPELIDVEATLDAQNTPVLINIQTPQQSSPQQPPLTSNIHSPHNMPSLIIDNSSLQNTQKLNKILVNNKHLTPVKISTTSGMQTVHVSTTSATIPASSKPLTSILTASNNPQSLLLNHNRSQSPIVVASTASTTANKKISTKPMLISQNQTPPLVSQKFDETTYIIPINISGKGGGKKAAAISPKVIKNLPNNPPALTSTVTQKSILQTTHTANVVQQQKINVSRSNQILQPGKSLINPALIQQRGTVISSSTANLVPTQKQIQVRPNMSMAKTMASPTLSTVTTQQQQQSLTSAQQKQLLQNIIVQQKQHAQQRGTATLVATSPSRAQTIKSIIIAPTQQAIIAASGAKNITTATATQAVSGTSLINPQIIQIQQNAGISGNQGKIQTLTPQQQQNLIATLKQHQIKTSQQQQRNLPQQSLIIKQQPVLQHIQHKTSNSPATSSSSSATSIIKSGQSLLGTNVVASASPATKLMASPQSIVTRIIKPGTSIIQQSVQQTTQQINQQQIQQINQTQNPTNQASIQRVVKSSPPTQPQQPVTAKVLTNAAGQIISLDSLLQKGFGPGTALRVQGSKPGQTSLIQLPSVPGSQVTQYAVVSQGRSIIPIQNAQRLVTTSASNLSSIIKTDVKPSQSQTNLLTTTSITQQTPTTATKIIQQTTNQAIGIAGGGSKLKPGIRMVNASNLNLAQFGGKPVIIASKTTPNTLNKNIMQSHQNVILQTSTASASPSNNGGTNFVITQGGQALKILPPGAQGAQTVMLNNQLVKVQTQPMQVAAASSSMAQGNIATSSNQNPTGTKTVVIGTKLQQQQQQHQQSPQQQNVINASPSSSQGGGHHQVIQQQQQVVLGTTLKNVVKTNQPNTQQRVVFAVQGGGQFILPQGFQGGAINLKSLQGLKVVPIQQNQQHSKG